MARREMEALEASPMFAGLSQRDLRRIAKATEVYEYEGGTEIVREGTASEGFFVILDGTARVRKGTRTVRRLGPGDFFGEIGVLDGGPRTATVTADVPLSAVVLLRSEFRGLMMHEPAVAYRILRGAARRLRSVETTSA